LGADKGYDSPALVAGARAWGVTPHVAQNIHARLGGHLKSGH
jgi:hypothetical protein